MKIHVYVPGHFDREPFISTIKRRMNEKPCSHHYCGFSRGKPHSDADGGH